MLFYVAAVVYPGYPERKHYIAAAKVKLRLPWRRDLPAIIQSHKLLGVEWFCLSWFVKYTLGSVVSEVSDNYVVCKRTDLFKSREHLL